MLKSRQLCMYMHAMRWDENKKIKEWKLKVVLVLGALNDFIFGKEKKHYGNQFVSESQLIFDTKIKKKK